MAEKSQDFEVEILLEHTRGSRGTKNSRTMLLPLLQNFPDYVKINLYHTPKLRGLLRALVPERFNETVSAMHMKVYIFDDTLVMSGLVYSFRLFLFILSVVFRNILLSILATIL